MGELWHAVGELWLAVGEHGLVVREPGLAEGRLATLRLLIARVRQACLLLRAYGAMWLFALSWTH